MNDDDLHYLISGPDVTRGDPFGGYRYCPRCRNELQLATTDDKERPQCPSCGFIFYRNPAPAAGAILVRDGAILLVQRSVDPRQNDWCIPAGFIEWNEHPQQTAVRELKEETGLDISIRTIFDIFFGMDDPRTHAVLILYIADVVGGQIKPGDDAADVRWFDFDHLPANIAFQAHRDALALYRKRHLLR
jgi:ADP-ribose pyrophosphatase YjhB (NUDIX family)